MYGPRIHMRPDARPRRKLLRRCRGARTTGGIEDDEKSPPAVSRCGVYGVPGASSLSLLLAGARALTSAGRFSPLGPVGVGPIFLRDDLKTRSIQSS